MLRMRKPRARQENEAGTLQPFNIPFHAMLWQKGDNFCLKN
jgi:hypothetical protein